MDCFVFWKDYAGWHNPEQREWEAADCKETSSSVYPATRTSWSWGSRKGQCLCQVLSEVVCFWVGRRVLYHKSHFAEHLFNSSFKHLFSFRDLGMLVFVGMKIIEFICLVLYCVWVYFIVLFSDLFFSLYIGTLYVMYLICLCRDLGFYL